MKRVVSLLVILSMLIPVAACRRVQEKPNNVGNNVTITPTATPTIIPTATPEADPAKLEDTSKRVSVNIVQNKDGVCNKAGREVVSITYDTATLLTDGEAAGFLGDSLKSQADEFLKEFYNADAEEITKENPEGKYEADFNILPKRIEEGLASFVVVEYSYLMGVHPNTFKLASNYDLENQRQLKLEDLTEDYAALDKFLQEYVLKLMSEYKDADGFFNDYKNSVSSIVTDGAWYFSEDGITFICNAYTIGPYALGIMEFTVPYEELSSYINEKWLPKEHLGGAEDTASVSIASEYDTLGYEVYKLNLNSQGRTFAITTDKTIYDVTISSVTYDSSNEEFLINRVMYKCSRLSSKELLEITAVIPELIPDLQLTYKLMDGSTITNYITESGKDGSLLLVEK